MELFLMSGTPLLWLFPIAVLALLAVGVKLAPKGEFRPEPMEPAGAKCLQGICAVTIILHHACQALGNRGENPGALLLFKDAGVLFVAVFFFFSGYGLFKSLLTKADYLKHFLRHRLLTVLIPFWVCSLVFILWDVASGADMPAWVYAVEMTGWWPANDHMWYIIEIVLLYLLFWAAFRLIKNRDKALAAISVPIVLLVVCGPLFGHGGTWFQGEWWYNTTILFLAGMLMARFEKGINAFLQKHFAVMLAVFAVCFAALYAATSWALNNWSFYDTLSCAYATLLVQELMVLCWVALIVTLLQKVRFGNPVSAFLGGVGLEIYLLHNLFLYNLPLSSFGYVLVTEIGAIALAVLVHWADKKLVGLAAGKQKVPADNK